MNRNDEYVDEMEPIGQDPLEDVFAKIEEANLYKALLNEQLFEESSASAEVVEKVTNEVRQFVFNRLQVLVGQAPSDAFVQPLPFNDRQISVLKILADRIINAPPTRSEPIPRQQKNVVRPRKPEVQKPNIQKSVATNKLPKKSNRPASGNVSEITGQDYSQATNPTGRLAMPTQAEIDARNAVQVAKNQANMGGGDWGKILQAAATVYQKQNATIQED
jgi:hypothetical protein